MALQARQQVPQLSLVVVLARLPGGGSLLAAAVYGPQLVLIETAAAHCVLIPGSGLQVHEVTLKRARILLGRQVKARRKQLGIHQHTMAAALNFSRANVSDSEMGRRLGHPDLWKAIDAYLGANGEFVRRRDRIAAMQTATRMTARRHGEGATGGRLNTGVVGGGGDDAIVAARERTCPNCGYTEPVIIETRVLPASLPAGQFPASDRRAPDPGLPPP